MPGLERRSPALAGPGYPNELGGQAQHQCTEIDVPTRQGRHRQRCPRCDKGRRDDALSVLVDQHGACWLCWRCGWRGSIKGGTSVTGHVMPKPDQRDRDKRRLRRLWRESAPLDLDRHTVVANYLRSRGLEQVLDDTPADLRFHPRLDYWRQGDDGPVKAGHFPAIIAVIRNVSGEPTGLHRTYLRHDGSSKAAVPSPRKLCPPAKPNGLRGGAIRLYPAAPELAVAEGIETALALRCLADRAVWATRDEGGMRALELPTGVRDVLIGADNDDNGVGQRAARELARRLVREGRQVRIATPGRPGDWNDVLQAEGAAA